MAAECTSSSLVRWLADCLVEAYLDDRENVGLKPKTLDWYRWHLGRAQKWLEDAPEWHALDILTPEGLQAYYRSTRNLAKTTRRHMVAALQAFGAWLEKEHGLANPAKRLKKPRPTKELPKVLSPTELLRLLAVLDDESPRERALVLLFLDTGLRVSEVASLKRADVDVAAGQLTVRCGKGNKGRVVFFFVQCGNALAEYLATHDHEAVFVGERRGRSPDPLTDNGIRQILRRLAARHGFTDLSPHTLRRTCGTELAANGVDLSTIADQLGHEEVTTTRMYTRLADVRRREVLRRASPVDQAANRSRAFQMYWSFNPSDPHCGNSSHPFISGQ